MHHRQTLVGGLSLLFLLSHGTTISQAQRRYLTHPVDNILSPFKKKESSRSAQPAPKPKLAAGVTLTTLVKFNGRNGEEPEAGLVVGKDGNFYGTTRFGGSVRNCILRCGTVFRLTPRGNLTTLVSFGGGNSAEPIASLALGKDGNFYSTTFGKTSEFGIEGLGTVFQITPAGKLTKLADFIGSNGANPIAGLTVGPDGNFYGTAFNGGKNDQGTVFRLTPSGNLKTLVTFDGRNGSRPAGDLILGPDGNFYGTTFNGGRNDQGTVFQLNPKGNLTTLVAFNGRNGGNPTAGLVLGWDGNFYGTTFFGGNNNQGTVFRVNPKGNLKTLVSFNEKNGAQPTAGLVLGRDGDFYGTTLLGGLTATDCSLGCGTVFKVTAAGKLTTLVAFSGRNGQAPEAELLLDKDGSFYGTTSRGGSDACGTGGCGTVFRLNVPYRQISTLDRAG